jgi:hypothetical protein
VASTHKVPVVGAFAFLCLLMAGSASAWVPTPNRPRMTPPAHPAARYVPAPSRADSVPGHDVPVALLSTGFTSGRSATSLERGRSVAADDWSPSIDARLRDGNAGTRGIASEPSHWGATHLQI